MRYFIRTREYTQLTPNWIDTIILMLTLFFFYDSLFAAGLHQFSNSFIPHCYHRCSSVSLYARFHFHLVVVVVIIALFRISLQWKMLYSVCFDWISFYFMPLVQFSVSIVSKIASYTAKLCHELHHRVKLRCCAGFFSSSHDLFFPLSCAFHCSMLGMGAFFTIPKTIRIFLADAPRIFLLRSKAPLFYNVVTHTNTLLFKRQTIEVFLFVSKHLYRINYRYNWNSRDWIMC